MKKFAFAVLMIGFAATSANAQGVVVRGPSYGPAPYGAASHAPMQHAPMQHAPMQHSPMQHSGAYQVQRPAYAVPYPGYHYPSQYHVQRPVQTTQQPASSGGFFGELMEMERRKNAWLKRTFLGM